MRVGLRQGKWKICSIYVHRFCRMDTVIIAISLCSSSVRNNRIKRLGELCWFRRRPPCTPSSARAYPSVYTLRTIPQYPVRHRIFPLYE